MPMEPTARAPKWSTNLPTKGPATMPIMLGRVTAKDILGAVAGETGLPGNMIGKIEIHGDFTFVEVPQDYASEVIRKMKGRYIKGNKVTLGPAGEKK